MKIPKRRESKIKNGSQKRPDMFMRVISIFMAFFFVAMFICILILNSRRGKTDNTQKDASNEKDKSSNVVNIEEKKAISNNKNEYKTTLSSFVNDTIEINNTTFSKDQFRKKRQTKIDVNDMILEIERDCQISEQTGDTFNLIEFFTKSLFKKINQENDPTAEKIIKIFNIIYETQKSINSYSRITLLDNNDRSPEIDSLKLYINYKILYEGLYGISKVLKHVIKDNTEFKEKVENNLREISKMDKFIGAYAQALKDSSTNVYKETEVDIPPFKDNKDGTQKNTATVFLIQDFDKVTNFVMLTFYQVYLYIFTYDTENKEIHLSTEVIDVTKKILKPKLETFNQEIMKVNSSCSELFNINVKELGNHSLISNVAYRNCFDNINTLMMG